jgi:predicted DsbA family dithiol-disulfide isomerase
MINKKIRKAVYCLKVEIWSDIACPFCYIGKRQFEAALNRFKHKDPVEVVYRSFELDPNAKRDNDFDVYDMLAGKYGMTREQAISANDGVAKQAQSVGLTFRFDTMILTNTFDAHRMTHFAAKYGKMKEMTERLFQAYFSNSLHVGDREVLAGLAADIGLDKAEAAAVLAGGDFTDHVRADEQEARKFGINGVPFFVINRKYGVSGAQASDVFLNALQQAWDEEHPKLTMKGGTDGAGVCTDEGCDVPPADGK